MSKTPVSILQELMQRRSDMAHFELILSNSQGIGTHLPTFHYQVIAGPVQAIGKARSKKDAKHEAARLALEKLADLGIYHPNHVPASPSPISTPDPSSPVKIQVNAVGALQELCTENNIPQPEFRLTADEGPAHLRQFTIECKITTMTVSSTDTTKKKAKQNAAQKMLHRLMDTLPEVIEEYKNREPSSVPAVSQVEEMLKNYNDLSTLNKKKINWGRRISSYPVVLKNLMTEKNVSSEDLWKDITEKDAGSLQDLLNKIELNYSLDFCEQEEDIVALLSLNSDPEFVFCGVGEHKEDAMVQALSKSFDFLRIMTT